MTNTLLDTLRTAIDDFDRALRTNVDQTLESLKALRETHWPLIANAFDDTVAEIEVSISNLSQKIQDDPRGVAHDMLNTFEERLEAIKARATASQTPPDRRIISQLGRISGALAELLASAAFTLADRTIDFASLAIEHLDELARDISTSCEKSDCHLDNNLDLDSECAGECYGECDGECNEAQCPQCGCHAVSGSFTLPADLVEVQVPIYAARLQDLLESEAPSLLPVAHHRRGPLARRATLPETTVTYSTFDPRHNRDINSSTRRVSLSEIAPYILDNSPFLSLALHAVQSLAEEANAHFDIRSLERHMIERFRQEYNSRLTPPKVRELLYNLRPSENSTDVAEPEEDSEFSDLINSFMVDDLSDNTEVLAPLRWLEIASSTLSSAHQYEGFETEYLRLRADLVVRGVRGDFSPLVTSRLEFLVTYFFIQSTDALDVTQAISKSPDSSVSANMSHDNMERALSRAANPELLVEVPDRSWLAEFQTWNANRSLLVDEIEANGFPEI